MVSKFSTSQLLSRLNQARRYLTTGWRLNLLNGLLLVVTLAIIGQILYTERETILTYEWEIRWGWLLTAVFLLLLDMLMGATAWHFLVKKFTNFDNPRQNIKIWWYANLAKRLPGPIWYIANRAILYEKQQIQKRQISLVSALELVLIFLSGIVLALITTPFWILPDELTARLGQTWLLILPLLMGALIFHPALLRRVWSWLSPNASTLQLRWGETAVWLLSFLLIWFVGGLVLFALCNSLVTIPWSQALSVISMWAVANTISIAGSLGFLGMGLREITLFLMLSQILPTPIALILTIVVRIAWLLGELITAALSLLL